ncbi:MAG: ABC transporter ATP-binding protein [Candidatus Sulfotelmatobacter sp.]
MPVASSISFQGPTSRRKAPADMLVVEGLTVQYRVGSRELKAVDQASFSVAHGEIAGLLGESGCGKTTTALSLLRMLPDAATMTSGRIYFGDRDLWSLSEEQLRKLRGAEVAIIFQDFAVLNPVMRVGNQVIEVLRAHSHCNLRQAQEKVHDLFTSIGLLDFDRIYHAYPHQLSGGQRQRIAIAQALICEPKLVIADEPTAHLDTGTAAEILAFMEHMRETHHTSFIIISHDPDILATVADRIVVMYAGQVVEDGPAEEVLSHPLHPYTRALLQCAPKRIATSPSVSGRKPFPSIPGDTPNPLEVLPGCSFSPRCADRMAVCDSHRASLLDQSGGRSVRCFKYEVE